MAADSAATKRHLITNEITCISSDFRKIYHVTKANLGISCWGLGTIQNKPILDFLAEFEESDIKRTDTIEEVAEKLKDCLQDVTPRIQDRMGLHLAGYPKKGEEYISQPQLRHIFHESWHKDGEFVCENYHIESLSEKRIPFPSYRPYPTLFNGDNAIANCLINYIPRRTQGRQRIEPASLTLEECIDLADLVVGVSIQRLNYYVDVEYRKIPKTVGGKIFIARITPTNGFEWVKK